MKMYESVSKTSLMRTLTIVSRLHSTAYDIFVVNFKKVTKRDWFHIIFDLILIFKGKVKNERVSVEFSQSIRR